MAPRAATATSTARRTATTGCPKVRGHFDTPSNSGPQHLRDVGYLFAVAVVIFAASSTAVAPAHLNSSMVVDAISSSGSQTLQSAWAFQVF